MDEITKEEIGSVFGEPKNYPRYQASFFIGENGDKKNQIVVRNDNWKEFVEDLTKVKDIQDKAKEKAKMEKKAAGAFSSDVQEETDLGLVCPHHKVKLVHRQGVSKKTGKPYDFWACPEMEDGKYCGYTWNPKKDSINKREVK